MASIHPFRALVMDRGQNQCKRSASEQERGFSCPPGLQHVAGCLKAPIQQVEWAQLATVCAVAAAGGWWEHSILVPYQTVLIRVDSALISDKPRFL